MIDKELVTRKVLLITEDLRALGALAAKPVAEYLASATDEVLAERYLERIIGRMIDINYHVLTESGQAPPPDYYQSFTALATIGMLDQAFAKRIAACAGLRNRITHEYEAIDPARVHEALQSAVRDIPEYLKRLAAHVGL
ncbi:MAG: hypothetical protein DMF77_12380 [Acidobacteria bacterium]|nr:MAG: hypothetical protein DMF77_12380 [Acidobacteriota bacterium]